MNFNVSDIDNLSVRLAESLNSLKDLYIMWQFDLTHKETSES